MKRKKKNKFNNRKTNSVKPEQGYISLTEASKNFPYSQEYLSLLSRQGKLRAKKFGRNWFVTKEAIDEYLQGQGIKIILPKNLFNASYKGKITKPFDLLSISGLEPGFRKEPKTIFVGEEEMSEEIEGPSKEIQGPVEISKIIEEKRKQFEKIKRDLSAEKVPKPFLEKSLIRTMKKDIESLEEEEKQKVLFAKKTKEELKKKKVPKKIIPSKVVPPEVEIPKEAPPKEIHVLPKAMPVEDKILDRLLTALESRLSRRGIAEKIGEFNRIADQQFRSPVRAMLITIVAIVVIFLLVGGISFGNLDRTLIAVHNFFKDAETLKGHRPGTHANEVLLINKAGNISIYGHIETQGQLRSWVKDGIAPIVVDSTVTVENLSAEMLDGLKKEDFTLAFVTKNGNITYEDVKLEGGVEVGKTLLVKGAAKLLDNLFVYGSLGVWGDITGQGNLQIVGKSILKPREVILIWQRELLFLLIQILFQI